MQSFVSRCAIASLSRPPPQALQEGRRYQTQHSLGSSRDKHRGQPNADPTTGNQVSIVESPDLTHHLQFGLNNLEHVKIPDVSDEHRRRTDMEKERAMQKKFGNMGPGEQLTQSSPQKRRKMLQEQQDVDGLPWEVRWKKSLIPTSEEVVQDIRDRFDLYIQDPIDREQEWYLHWKDRSFKVQKDRMIWPQGYTDYLDHYDEHGRRRVLPSDQRWSDSSWKHLADTKYKDRMWLIEGEERKAVHQSLQTQETLIEEEEQRQLEMGDVYHGIISGVVDLDPDQTYQALSGTANPLEVAKTKMKIQTYGAYQALQSTSKTTAPVEIDPISGLPKSGMEPLPSGITVEQGAAIAAQGAIQYEMLEQEANAASNAGADPAFAVMKAHTDAAKKSGDQPIVQSQVEARMAMVKEQAHHAALGTSDAAARLERTMETIESPLLREAEAASSTPPPQSNDPTTSATEGYMSVESRPDDAEPNVPGELYRVPQSRELGDMPQWYRETLVETEPLIRSYGLVGDPLEAMQPEREFYTPPLMKEEDRITNDDAAGGGSVFDQEKLHKLRSLPELVEGFKPLPLYRDAASSASVVGDASTTASALTGADGKPLKKSERLKRERLERLRKSKLQYDPDVLLPSLPWETDSVVDPYRGIAKEDAIDFNKKDLELSWKAYRDTFQQCITEFGSLTQVTSEEKCERMLFDTMDRFRSGMVGDHPAIPEEAEDVLRLVFEAHTKHFLGDFYKYKGNRLTEAKTVKSEADELLRRASAKSKLLGQNFMNFIQEMTSLELDTIRKNPVQRYVVLVRDKKYESLAKPFMKWMQNELSPFNATQFESYEQLETHREFLMRHVNEARRKCPNRVEGISDSARDGAVEAFYHWCRGALCFYAGKHLHRMFIDYAETRFRSRAEELFEDSIEWFGNYASAAKDVVQIPIPEADPPYEYDEKDFLDGESAIIAEISGHLDKAEGLWHSGTSKRWYPMTDETEYMWYNERRGRITLALDISDRCLENVNKKTHPSIHPFPERARIFLEGAPLTQETAEHLWLRYMGDLYYEHSELMMRQGRFQMGHNYREKCLNFYHTAIRTAQERLPTSWTAPVLTTAKYMMRVYVPGAGEVERHVKELETLVDRLFAVPEPSHWVEPFSELPYRLAIVHANIPAYGELITKEVARQLNWQPSNELLMKNMERRSKGFGNLPELDEYYRTVNEVAQRLFRDKILRWRAREREGSDPYLFWTHLYFAFRVHPKDDVERQQLWDIYEPAYLYIYTQCALANRVRGQYLINDALRRICQILTEGNVEQRQTLLTELNKVREKLVHLVDRQEMDRTITSLEAFSKSPTQPPYMYGTGLLYREAVKHERIAQNPLLRTKLASKDYAEMKDRQDAVRAHGGSLHPHTAQQQQQQQQDGGGCSKFGDEPCDSQAPPTTKQMFSD